MFKASSKVEIKKKTQTFIQMLNMVRNLKFYLNIIYYLRLVKSVFIITYTLYKNTNLDLMANNFITS